MLLEPMIKWPGGKRWIIPVLEALPIAWNDVTLMEPFCGGCSVSLGLSPRRAILNDKNPHVINLYRQVRQGLSLTLRPRNEASSYYRYRERFNGLIETGDIGTPLAAQIFYVLSKFAWNGLIRHSRSGKFNTPFGRYNQVNLTRDFSVYRKQFQRWRFESKDFSMLTPDPEWVMYLDPPYHETFTTYTGEAFTWEDQLRTLEWAKAHTGPTIISNNATRQICRLYKQAGFKIKILSAPRRISCTGDRTRVPEVLAYRGL